MNPSLSELLQRAECLANETQMLASHPPVEKTLPEVLQETDEMHKRLTQTSTEPTENTRQAMMMLGVKGIDVQLLTDKVKNLDMGKAFESSVGQWDTDVAGYLENKLQTMILDLIEETNANIFKKVKRRKWRSLYAEWENEKMSMLNALTESDEKPRTATTAKTAATRSSLHRIQLLYVTELMNYNKCKQRRMNLLTTFTQLVEKQLKDVGITKMWNVLEHMTKQTPLCFSKDAVKTRQDAPQFLQQALLYLEHGYRKHMYDVIQRNRSIYECGGIPNVYSKVKSFVRNKFQQPQSLCNLCDVFKRRPLWPHVFYSLRCGDPEAAVQFLKDWDDVCPDLRQLIQQQHELNNDPEFCEHSLRPARMKMTLSMEYKNSISSCSDPYKKAVYAIVLACESNDSHSEVLSSIEDSLWMQLRLRKFKQLSIDDLHLMMSSKYGVNYLTECGTTPIYFQLLILTGHFEAAIEFLVRKEENEVHAVHMAIALDELAMIGKSSNELDPLLDQSTMCSLNVMRLIISYAAGFGERNKNCEAFNYYYMLNTYSASNGCNLMLKCIKDFVLHNYKAEVLDLIFGKPDPCNALHYSGGFFDKLPCPDFDKRALATMVAAELIKRCEYEQAIEMYLRSGQLDDAVHLICSVLAQTVHLPTRKAGIRRITDRLNLAVIRCSSCLATDEIDKFKLFSCLLNFFDSFNAAKTRQALELLDECQLIPQRCEQIELCRSRAKVLGADAVKVMPNVLLAAMETIFKEYQTDKLSKKSVKLQLRERAKALINFVATLPYRLTPDTNKRLVQLELNMQT